MTVENPSIRTPGFLVRRLQQVSVSIFHERLLAFDLTPIQYTILRILEDEGGLDQMTIASRAVLDASSVMDVLKRLESKKLVSRIVDRQDKRKRLASLTRRGHDLLEISKPAVRQAQMDFLAPLSAKERDDLLRMIERLLASHEHLLANANGSPWRRVRSAKEPEDDPAHGDRKAGLGDD